MDGSDVTGLHAIWSVLSMLLLFGLPIWLMMFLHFSKEKEEKKKSITKDLLFRRSQHTSNITKI